MNKLSGALTDWISLRCRKTSDLCKRAGYGTFQARFRVEPFNLRDRKDGKSLKAVRARVDLLDGGQGFTSFHDDKFSVVGVDNPTVKRPAAARKCSGGAAVLGACQ